MKTRNFFTASMALTILGWTAFGNSSSSFAQDKAKTEESTTIRIVDRDGREINPKLVIVRGAAQDQDKAAPNPITVNGVVTVVDADGNKKTIQANSVIVRQSQQTTIENGEERTEVIKKAIVTDGDGNVYELDLTNPDEPVAKAVAPMILSQSSVGRFMIGVSVQPVAEALAEQLNLEAGTGLTVQSVVPESPAEKRGLQENDVLLFANQTPLASVEDLNEVVQKAGQEEISVSITLVRDDKEMSIEVTPTKRTAMTFKMGLPGKIDVLDLNPEFQKAFEQMNDFQFDWQQAGPGFVFEMKDFDPQAFKAQFQEMMEQHAQQMEQFKQQMEQNLGGVGGGAGGGVVGGGGGNAAPQPKAQPAAPAATQNQIDELLNEIKSLRKEIETLKKNQRGDK